MCYLAGLPSSTFSVCRLTGFFYAQHFNSYLGGQHTVMRRHPVLGSMRLPARPTAARNTTGNGIVPRPYDFQQHALILTHVLPYTILTYTFVPTSNQRYGN